MPHAAAILELFSTSALTGLIWFVQLAHYPALRDLGGTPAFYRNNAANTSLVVVPLMLLEAAASAFLLYHHRDVLHLSLFLLVVAIWLVTFTLAAPVHRRLGDRGYERPRVVRLISRNWPRTVLWTARCATLLYLQVIPPSTP